MRDHLASVLKEHMGYQVGRSVDGSQISFKVGEATYRLTLEKRVD